MTSKKYLLNGLIGCDILIQLLGNPAYSARFEIRKAPYGNVVKLRTAT